MNEKRTHGNQRGAIACSLWNDEYERYEHDMDACANLDKLMMPVHIYHGKDDNIVPLTASQKAMKRLKDARLTTLEDTGHALTPEQQAQIGIEIADEIFNGMK